MKFTYKLQALRGLQAGCSFYVCMIPLKYVKNFFINIDYDVPPECRAQRKLNESRIPEIKDYIINNRDSYVFSALAASIDGEIKFISSDFDKDLGILEIDMDSKILINDGQHRKAAILAAIEEDETLLDETIPVVLFADKGLERSQQMFTDLNKHAVTTSKSLNALYDSKDRTSILTKKLVDKIDFLNRYTDKEKDNLGKFSSKLFTLNSLVNSNKRIVKCSVNDEDILNFMIEYWGNIISNISEWQELINGKLSKLSLREDYIVTQGVCILAFGYLGEYIFINHRNDYIKYLVNLKNIDWTRTNKKDWLNCAIKPNGRINRSDRGIFLTYLKIKKLIGFKLYAEESNKLRKL